MRYKEVLGETKDKQSFGKILISEKIKNSKKYYYF